MPNPGINFISGESNFLKMADYFVVDHGDCLNCHLFSSVLQSIIYHSY